MFNRVVTPHQNTTPKKDSIKYAKNHFVVDAFGIRSPIISDTNEQPIDNYSKIDQLLEKEKQHNKTESWNKLDKTVKIQKLHAFSEKYGRENAMANKDIKLLKTFFKECLEKNKLQKTKDVTYDKETYEIIAIPSLVFNRGAKNFTLKNMDPKRISTLKSLTPKRIIVQEEEEQKDEDPQEPIV